MSRGTVDLSHEQLDELVEAFKTMDTDASGFIEASELQDALDLCGIKLPGYEIRDIIKQNDTKIKDGKIDIDEFKTLYAKLRREKDFGHKYKKQVAARQGIETHGGTSQASVEGTTHTVKKAETTAFASWINRNLQDDPDCQDLVPIDCETDDLYKCVKNGILICKLINCSVPDTIDERTINKGKISVYKQHENHTLALNSASSIGCNIVNIGAQDLMEGKPHLVLGLLWQVIKIGLLSDINLMNHPGLVLLLEEGEEPDDLRKLSPEQILIRWVNYHLKNAGSNLRIRNFGDDIKDSEAYTLLLHQIAPKDRGVNLGPLGETDNLARAEGMLGEADKIGCRSFVTPKDVVTGNVKLNLAFVANLFNTYPALVPPEDIDFVEIEETREEKTYRNWMNSMGVNPFVQYLYNDLKDGNVIFQLYDIIKPGCVNWTKVIRKFNKMRMNFEKLENCNYAVDLGKQCKFSLVGIGGQDILEGNETLTLALVWQLMRGYTLSLLTKISSSSSPVNDKLIREWANDKLKEGGKRTSFTSFQDSSLSDSKAILDLIDCIKRNMVNFDLVKDCSNEEDRLSNAKYAISMARKIGAKVYALPEDIVEVKPKMVMTIFACLMLKDFQVNKTQED